MRTVELLVMLISGLLFGYIFTGTNLHLRDDCNGWKAVKTFDLRMFHKPYLSFQWYWTNEQEKRCGPFLIWSDK